MHTDTTRPHPPVSSPVSPVAPVGAPQPSAALEQALDAIFDDVFLSIGQAVGLRASFDYEAVLWVRNHFRPKFLNAMRHFGNRWLEDRSRVTAVCAMFGERAVRYANGADVIDVDAVRQAGADVERYCQLHAARAGGARGRRTPATDAATAMIAGYWCIWDPTP
jgi:hypothetical protein